MIDISTVTTGLDLGMYDSQTPRAANILNVQLGALEYAPEIGIDLAYFLDERFSFQNESFQAYLVERLANFGINASSVSEIVDSLNTNYTFNIKGEESNTGLISR